MRIDATDVRKSCIPADQRPGLARTVVPEVQPGRPLPGLSARGVLFGGLADKSGFARRVRGPGKPFSVWRLRRRLGRPSLVTGAVETALLALTPALQHVNTPKHADNPIA